MSSLIEGWVEFIAVDAPNANRLMIHVLAAFTEHKRSMISDRTKAALSSLATQNQTDTRSPKFDNVAVLLVHGSVDPVVPVSALHAAEHALRRLGVDVATHVSTGIGHSVDPVGLRLGAEFVGRVLRGKKQPQ